MEEARRIAELIDEQSKQPNESLPKGICPNCKAIIPLASPKCPHCPAEFNNPDGWKVIPQRREENTGSTLATTQQLYEATIGSRNTAYYLEKFEQFDQQGPGLEASWNWPALFFSGLWALYRKMYGWFAAWLVFSAFANASYSSQNVSYLGLILIIHVGLLVVFAIYANSLYHRSVQQKIASAKPNIPDQSKLHELLGNKGGVHAWVAWVFGLIPVVGIVAAIALPVYQDQQKRTGHEPGPNWDAGVITPPSVKPFTGKLDCPGPYNRATWTDCIGELMAEDGAKYVGEFKDGRARGQGTQTWPDGAQHVGEYEDNKFHGQGTYLWANGWKYVGRFWNNQIHGVGTMYRPDGTVEQSGTWQNGSFTGIR